MQNSVLLVTVNRGNDTKPIAHGIYANMAQVLNGLGTVGIHPGFDCTAKQMFNRDGTVAGVLFGSGDYVATVSAMPLAMAALLARGGTTWDVPDTAEGIE